MATTITADITASDNVITVAASQGVAKRDNPESGYRLVIAAEAMWVYDTSDDGLQCRVRRGIDGTTAAAASAGDTATKYAPFVVMYHKAGAISDSDFDADDLPGVGFIGYDTTNHKFYVREGAATWKSSVALT